MKPLPELRTRFPEPVVESGADPYVVLHDGYFYYIHVTNDQAIYIRKASTLEGIGAADAIQVWPRPGKPLMESAWAPELHLLDEKWYIYFADGPKGEPYAGQRNYVLEGTGNDPQTAKYILKGKIADISDQRAIDGTVLTLDDGRRYYLWSGWDNDNNMIQNIYIAQMANPWTLIGERIRIASPVYPWEKQKIGVNEGPQILPQGSKRHVIYSASHFQTDHYCLGQLSLVGDDPLEPTHWIKRSTPIFESHEGIISPGHASFLLTPDEKLGWMIFHSARKSGAWLDRQVRLAAFEVADDGGLRFISRRNIFDEVSNRLNLRNLLDKLVKKSSAE